MSVTSPSASTKYSLFVALSQISIASVLPLAISVARETASSSVEYASSLGPIPTVNLFASLKISHSILSLISAHRGQSTNMGIHRAIDRLDIHIGFRSKLRRSSITTDKMPQPTKIRVPRRTNPARTRAMHPMKPKIVITVAIRIPFKGYTGATRVAGSDHSAVWLPR